MNGKLPNLLIIGAMKAGTTSLHHYLSKHPEIFMSENKEIHYFADKVYQNHDLEWYKKQFITEKPIIGTSPQNYTKCHNKYYQNIPERIKKHLPKSKFIYILRDPIERYKSHVLENYYGEPSGAIKYNIQSDHYIKTGLYFMQLKSFLEYFPLSRFHILTLEDLIQDRLGTLNKIFKFLEIHSIEDASVFDFVSNSHKSKALPRHVSKSYLYRGLKKVFPSTIDEILKRPILKELLLSGVKKKDFEPEELEKLKAVYHEDKLKLEKLTGRKFDQWSI